MQYITEYKTENGKTKKVPEKKEQTKKTDQKTSSSNTNYEDSTKTTPTGE